MSTPIEIVRAFMERDSPPHMPGPSYLAVNLAAVLEMAERFRALERAHRDDDIYVSTPVPNEDDVWAPHDGTLAELADRLIKEKTTT